MNQKVVFKFVSLGVLLALLAGVLMAWPVGVARATVATHYDYCVVSGITSPSGANGTYYYLEDYKGYPTYSFGSYLISIGPSSVSFLGGGPVSFLRIKTFITPSWWYIIDSETRMFYNTSFVAYNPPENGWITMDEELYTGIPTLTCDYGTPPDDSAPQSTPEPTKTPITYIFGDGRQVNLSCQKTLSFGLIVPGGDMALLSCPIAGLASDDKLSQDDLPAGVTGGTFVAGFDLEINGGGSPLTVLPTPYIVAFKIPEGVTADKLAILWWDAGNSKWVELPTAVNLLTDKVTDLGNGRKVIVGTHQYTRTHVAATVNFTGIFVLIQK